MKIPTRPGEIPRYAMDLLILLVLVMGGCASAPDKPKYAMSLDITHRADQPAK